MYNAKGMVFRGWAEEQNTFSIFYVLLDRSAILAKNSQTRFHYFSGVLFSYTPRSSYE